MNARIRMTMLGLAGAGLLAACAETDGASAPGQGPGANHTTARGETLTAPSRAPAREIIAGFLSQLPGGRPVDTLAVASAAVSPVTGHTHVRMEQIVGGLRVVDGYVKATLTPQGELVHVIDQLVAVPAGGVPAMVRDDRRALAAALGHLGLPATTRFHQPPRVEAVAYADEAGALRPGYQVETWTADGNQLHHTLVAADGTIVRDELRTSNDRYNVFREDPAKGGQTVVSGPAPGGTASPSGWLGTGAQTTVNIQGNNARAYLDTDANNAADSGGTAVSTGDFLTAVDLGVSPSTTGNKAVAVQNLFYLTNRTHDLLYARGFTEAVGNFQVDNFGRGGAGNDPVQAEAQDGSGTDNANFSTPSDGSAPRMQMYLWSSAAPESEVVSGLGTFGARAAGFGPALTTGGINGAIALIDDGAGTTSDGCEAFTGATGKIALVDRGTCDFVTKVQNAQNAGAIAVIVANNTGGSETFAMGGTARRIRIPSVMVSQNAGATLRAGTTGTVRKLAVAPPMIDGDLDSDIVYHEYGHGLTWRMVGGMSGALAGAIGEGASDVVAMFINGGDVIGEYAYGNPLGIRRYRYAGYPLTYKDAISGEVHDDGEIYAAIMYRLMEIYDREGLARDELFHTFVDGMNYTPATPAFEDMRDGMLQSVALAGSGRECLIWEAFAQFGVGVGADGAVSRRGKVTIVESFATPATCP